MKRIALATLGLAAGLAGTSASAGTIGLWMSDSSKPAAYSTYTTGTMQNPAGYNNKYWTATVSDADYPEYGAFEVRVYGFSTANNDGTGVLNQRDVQRYSGGLGICDGTNSADCSTPQHAADNDGTNDYFLIDFGEGHEYSASAFSIGWEYYSGCSVSTVSNSCPDIEAWIGNSFNAALGLAGITGSWTQILDGDPQNNIQPGLDYPLGAGSGQYLLIGAQTGSEYCWQSGWDYDKKKKTKTPVMSCEYDHFKLQSIALHKDPKNPPEEIPEPGPLALLGLAALGIAITRRRFV